MNERTENEGSVGETLATPDINGDDIQEVRPIHKEFIVGKTALSGDLGNEETPKPRRRGLSIM